MCYAKPGPRCSAHTKEALAKAKAAYKQNPCDETKQALLEAKQDWNESPEGIKEAEAKAAAATDPAEKEKLEQRARAFREARESKIAAYHAEHAAKLGQTLRMSLENEVLNLEGNNAPVSEADVYDVRVLNENGKTVVEVTYQVYEDFDFYMKRWGRGTKRPNFEEEVDFYLSHDYEGLIGQNNEAHVARIRDVVGEDVEVRTKLEHTIFLIYSDTFNERTKSELGEALKQGTYWSVKSSGA